MISQLLKDHCLSSFPLAFTRDFNALLTLTSYSHFIHGENNWGAYHCFPCLFLFIELFFLPVCLCACVFVIDFSYQIIYCSVIHLYLFHIGSWYSIWFPRISPWRGGNEKNKRCAVEHWFSNLADDEKHMRYFRELQTPDSSQRLIQ